MKQFSNFKQYIFTHLFPQYYHDHDTYKDDNGKGILERFIDSCSMYLDDYITGSGTNDLPGLDNFLDNLDVDIMPDLFLNYLWEYFGYFPYSYGLIIQGETYSPEDIKKQLREYSKQFPRGSRKILKYAISLYKIRGTLLFFKILGKFYGVRFEILETNQQNEWAPSRVALYSRGSYDGSNPKYPEGMGVGASYTNVKATYGITENTDDYCRACVPIKIKVYLDQSNLSQMGLTPQIYDEGPNGNPDGWPGYLKDVSRYPDSIPTYQRFIDENGNDNGHGPLWYLGNTNVASHIPDTYYAFAKILNKFLPLYVSRFPDSESEGYDVKVISSNFGTGYGIITDEEFNAQYFKPMNESISQLILVMGNEDPDIVKPSEGFGAVAGISNIVPTLWVDSTNRPIQDNPDDFVNKDLGEDYTKTIQLSNTVQS